MKKNTISSQPTAYAYDVVIGADLLDRLTEYLLISDVSSVFVLSDSNLESIYVPRVVDALRRVYPRDKIVTYSIPAGEESKSLQNTEIIYRKLFDMSADRKTLCVNIGGGVVSDLGGFAASTFMRGIRFVNVPTTIEAMVDASVGGKTGVNFAQYKNYIGTFAQPSQVIVDVSVLRTLPERPMRQGFAEVIKHALIADKEFFSNLSKMEYASLQDPQLIDIIEKSIQIKSKIVQQDPLEKAQRKLLNFGHTVGHAIESLSIRNHEALFHGEAVSIGMVAESQIALKEGLLTQDECEQIIACLMRFNLPVHYVDNTSLHDIEILLAHDKKNTNGITKWTLLKKIGQGIFDYEAAQPSVLHGLQFITAP